MNIFRPLWRDSMEEIIFTNLGQCNFHVRRVHLNLAIILVANVAWFILDALQNNLPIEATL